LDAKHSTKLTVRTQMGGFSKVRVSFQQGSIVDFDQLLHDIQSEYQIGFAALFKIKQSFFLFIQRHEDASSRMALGKIKKICTKLAGAVEVIPFQTTAHRIVR